MQQPDLLELRSLLADERDAILGGRLNVLQDFAHRKQRLSERLLALGNPSLADEALLLLKRQGMLIEAARAGIDAARQRLEALRTVQGGGGYYDRAGVPKGSTAASKLERRA